MADSTLVGPPTQDVGLTAGSSGGGTGNPKAKRNLIIAGIAAVALGGVYLYSKSKSNAAAASSTTTAAPDVIEPASNADTAVSGYASSLSNQLNANQGALTNSLSSFLTSIEASIAGEQSAVVGAVQGVGSTAANTPAPQALPQLNAQDFAKTVLFGQYQPGQYTQIGEYTGGGNYQGTNVTGGAPVYIGVDGGFEQDFNPATVPAGTPVYIPTALAGYEAK